MNKKSVNPKDRVAAAKPCLSIIPRGPLYEVICALFEGAEKYDPWNWRDEDVGEVTYVDAACRHLDHWLCGEDIDKDSGIHHISKAIASLIIIRDAQMHGTSIDNRPVEQNVDFDKIMEMMAEAKARAAKMRAEREAKEKPPCCQGNRPEPVEFTGEFITAVPMTDEEVEECHRSEAEYAADEPAFKEELLKAGGGKRLITIRDVGRQFRARNGDVGHVVQVDLSDSWPVISMMDTGDLSDGETILTKCGGYFENNWVHHDYDIVSLLDRPLVTEAELAR